MWQSFRTTYRCSSFQRINTRRSDRGTRCAEYDQSRGDEGRGRFQHVYCGFEVKQCTSYPKETSDDMRALVRPFIPIHKGGGNLDEITQCYKLMLG